MSTPYGGDIIVLIIIIILRSTQRVNNPYRTLKRSSRFGVPNLGMAASTRPSDSPVFRRYVPTKGDLRTYVVVHLYGVVLILFSRCEDREDRNQPYEHLPSRSAPYTVSSQSCEKP